MVSRLISDHRDGSNRFNAAGERLYIAEADGRVLGVCGLNLDPYVADASVGRVRRLYVSVAQRRLGVGSVLVDQVVSDARGTFARLRLRTYDPIAAAFYVSRGFGQVGDDEFCTHQIALE